MEVPAYMAASGSQEEKSGRWLSSVAQWCPMLRRYGCCLQPRAKWLTDEESSGWQEVKRPYTDETDDDDDDVENPTLVHAINESSTDFIVNKNRKDNGNHGPMVMDLGSAFVRIGSAYDETPWCTRSQMCRPKATLSEDVRSDLERSSTWPALRSEAKVPEALLDMSSIVSADKIEDWDGLSAMVDILFTDTEAALIAAPLGFGTPSKQRKNAFSTFASNFLEIAFEVTPELGAISIVGAAPLPLFALGMTNGLGLTSGNHRSLVATVQDGLVKHATFFSKQESSTVLPDGTQIDFDDTIFLAPEILDSNAVTQDRRRRKLIECLTDEVCTRMRKSPFETELVLAGGATFVSGYTDALNKRLLPAIDLKLEGGPAGSSHLSIHKAEDDLASWRGASILATADDFSAWVMRHDYLELGAHRAALEFVF